MPTLDSSDPPAPAAPPPEPHAKVSWPRKLLVPAGALFAIAVSYYHQETTPEQPPLPALRSMQVTSSGGLDAHPSFSPDGSSFAYTSDRSGSFELYLRMANTSGGSDIQISSDGRQNIQPSWSPDGKAIAYHSARERAIYVIPALGGTALKVAEFGSEPSWAPDSRRIVFRSAPAASFALPEFAPPVPSTLWIATLGLGAPQQLTKPGNPAGRHESPSFSPDGKRVLFVNHTGRQAELWEIEADSGALLRHKTGMPYCYSPRFTPDGSGIFFFGGASPDSAGLYAMGIDKDTRAVVRPPERLMQFDSATPRDLAIGPETRRLAYTASTSASVLWQWSAKDGEKPLTSETASKITMPVFSPDGSKLVYLLAKKGDLADIWISDADGRNPAQITRNPSPDYRAAWSPDGRAVLYASQHGAWQYALATGSAKQLGRFDEVKMADRPSPDRSRIALALPQGQDTHLAIAPSGGGVPKQITGRPGLVWPWNWSPDGKQIAFSALWDGLWNVYTIEASGAEPKPITGNSAVRVVLGHAAWSPEGRRLVYERNEAKGNIFVAEPVAGGVNNR